MFRLLRSYLLALAPVLLAGTAAAQTCSVTLSSSSLTVAAAGGSGQFTVSSAAGCDWTAVSNAPAWLTISFGQTGSQNGSIGFSVARQDSNAGRTGTITINDKTFTVTQSAGSCAYALSDNTASFTSDGGTGSVAIDTLRGCTWSVTTLAPWVTVANPTGTGPGTINFSVGPATAARTAVLNIQTERLTIQQGAPCTFSVAASVPPVSGNGGTVNISVTASANTCSRTTSSSVDWIRVTSGAVATGSGTVTLTVSPNTTNLPRQATITINDTLLIINQLGSSCTFTLSPDRSTAVQTGGVGSITVQTQSGCPWTAASQVDWLTLTGTTTGTGNGSVTYAVGQNIAPEQRSGFITIGTRSFVVTQAGLGCTVRVDNNNLAVGSDGGSGTFSVAALTSCSWQATVVEPWLKVAPSSGSGTMDVTFTAEANSTNQVRVGRIIVGAAEVRVSQAASACRVSVGSPSLSMVSGGGSGQIGISTNCAWSARSSVDWIVLTSATAGSGDASLQYNILPNTGSDDRTGTITISGQTITITQAGQRCSLTVSATTASIPARGGNGSFNVTGGPACTWSAETTDSWLQVQFSSVNGSGTVRFTAPPNTSGQARETRVVVKGGQPVTIQQPPIVLTIGRDGVVNAASFAGDGAVSPGEIVTIYGSGFGPTVLAGLELTSNRQNVTSMIGDTRVLFDDVPSPMVYVVDGQLSAIVPYAVAGKQSTVLEVQYLGVKSNAVMLNVSVAAPGVFTLTQNGKGQAAVLNQDNSPNGSGGAGAQRNTVIQIFGTGEGQSRPTGVDGKLTTTPLPVVVAPVRVFVGGVEAAVTYSGGAPGLVAGLVQINARLAANTPVGDAVSLEVRINDVPSQGAVTIGVR